MKEPRFRSWTFRGYASKGRPNWLLAVWEANRRSPDFPIFGSSIDEFVEPGSDRRWELYPRAVIRFDPSAEGGLTAEIWALDEAVDQEISMAVAPFADSVADHR